jgi:Carboxypeptidase regulatory-like domain
MLNHSDGWQNGAQTLRRGEVFVFYAAVMLWLISLAGFRAGEPITTVKGIVRNYVGAPVAHAEVIARLPHGKIVATTVTNSRGRFHFLALCPRVSLVEVRCQGCAASLKQTVSVKSGQSLELNFVVSLADQPHTVQPSSMGALTFYSKPDFEAGGLKDPSAGGGYSDSASAQSRVMLRQYLPPSGSVSEGTISATGKKSGTTRELSDRYFERWGTGLLARKECANNQIVSESC